MSDATTLQKKVTRGKEAEVLLENSLFKEVAEACRKEWFKAFAGDDDDRAEEARHEIRAFERFLTKLVKIRTEGVAAHKQIEDLKKRQQEGESMRFNDIQGIV